MRIKQTTRQERDLLAWFVLNSAEFIGMAWADLWHKYNDWCDQTGTQNRGIEWFLSVLETVGVGGTEVVTVIGKPCPTCGRPGYSVMNRQMKG